MTDYYGAMGTAINSVLVAGTALTSLLSTVPNSGGTPAIYKNQAVNDATLPYVVYSHFSGGPENNPRGMRDNLWSIRAYANSDATAGRIDGEIDNLITDKELTVTGFSNFWTTRERDLPALVETPQDGELIFMAGALYRVRLGY